MLRRIVLFSNLGFGAVDSKNLLQLFLLLKTTKHALLDFNSSLFEPLATNFHLSFI